MRHEHCAKDHFRRAVAGEMAGLVAIDIPAVNRGDFAGAAEVLALRGGQRVVTPRIPRFHLRDVRPIQPVGRIHQPVDFQLLVARVVVVDLSRCWFGAIILQQVCQHGFQQESELSNQQILALTIQPCATCNS